MVTVDTTLLWLPLLMCLSLLRNVSLAKIFTSGTRVHMVPMVTFTTMLTNVTEPPVAAMVTDDPYGYIPNNITSFVTTANTGIELSW